MTLLDEALEAWGFAREGVIEEIENLSDRDMKFRPSDESRTVAELVAHILESGAMMAGELGEVAESGGPPDAPAHHAVRR